MSDKASVTFYPTVRAGYRPSTTFSASNLAVSDPSASTLELDLTGTGGGEETTETATVDFRMYGPGDVTGLDRRQIARVAPTPKTTAFPPNYFPLVEFVRADLPWLFSPQRADNDGRNQPWLALVCVPVGADGVEFSPAGPGPLPVLTAPAAQLPDLSQAWAWTHVQYSGRSTVTRDPNLFEGRNDRTLSRLVCPRNLQPKTKYRACVVPTYEPGRRAGLGLAPYEGEDETARPAWTDQQSVRLPVYHTWEFTSAKRGDFESLARELDPVTFGDDVGFRTIDVSDPGPETLKPEDGAGEGATVGVGGALRSVGATADGYGPDQTEALRDLLNSPDAATADTDYGAVGPPLYGEWHAGIAELEPPGADGTAYYYPTWFNALNADPRHRIAAGYGTQVVQDEQESLMESAWSQFDRIREANERLRRAQLSRDAVSRRFDALDGLDTTALLGLTAPVHAELFDPEAGRTVLGALADSGLSPAVTTPTFRQLTSANGALARRPAVDIDQDALSTLVESGQLPRVGDGLTETVPDASLVTGAQSAGGPGPGPGRMRAMSGDLPDGFDLDSMPPGEADPARPPEPERTPGVTRAVALLDSVSVHCETALDAVSSLSTAVVTGDAERVEAALAEDPTTTERVAAIGRHTFGPLVRALSKVLVEPRRDDTAPALTEERAQSDLATLQREQRGALERVEEAVAAIEQLRAASEAADGEGADSDVPDPEAIEATLRRAERHVESMLAVVEGLRGAVTRPAADGDEMMTQSLSLRSGDVTVAETTADIPTTLSLTATADMVDPPSFDSLRETALTGLDPEFEVPAYLEDRLGISLRTREDPVAEVLAHPLFPDPTYELLADLSQEYFLPGVGEIASNSVGVLETNPEFVEAFLAGLNHEMSRELRWRKFPTDRRGTYFRTFWDRRGPAGADGSERDDPEELADITPMHTWDEHDLGENSPHGDTASVVLLVRGELLRRYPNTDVFAAKAVEDTPPGTSPDSEGDRVPALPNTHVSRDDAGEDVKFPVFRGTLEPDITFFGFDLTTDDALYAPYDADSADDHPDEGWFFVLQEPPSETRFGLDVNQGDRGKTPPGVTVGNASTPAQVSQTVAREDDPERGWAALSWGHLVDEETDPASLRHVDVAECRPGRDGWSVNEGDSWVSGVTDAGQVEDIADPVFGEDDAAAWGHNSAHMARITWQRPVRVSIHADDMLEEDDGERLPTAQLASATGIGMNALLGGDPAELGGDD